MLLALFSDIRDRAPQIFLSLQSNRDFLCIRERDLRNFFSDQLDLVLLFGYGNTLNANLMVSGRKKNGFRLG